MARRKKTIKQVAKGQNILQIAGNLVVRTPEDVQSAFEEAVRLINQGPAKAEAAQTFLERLWRSCSDIMRPQQKSNCRRLIGCALDKQDKKEEAGRCFLEAKDLDPTWEKARAFEAVGYLYLGNPMRAHALAEDVLQEFSQNTAAWSVWIRTAPDALSFDDIKTRVPGHLSEDADVAVALATAAAARGDYAGAAQLVATAQEELPDNPRVTEMLGDLMFQRVTVDEQVLFERKASEKERLILAQAQELYTRSLKMWQEQGSVNGVIRVRLRRAWTHAALWEHKKAVADAEAAYEMSPDDPQVAYSYAVFIATENLDSAIEALRKVTGKDEKPGVEHLLGQMLRRRNGPKDREEAIAILKSRLNDLSSIPENSRTDYLELVMQLDRELSGVECAMETLRTVPTELVGATARAILQSQTLWLCDKKEESLRMAKSAYEGLDENTTLDDKRRLAVLLQTVGLYREAVRLWKSLVRTDCIGRDTYKMIACAKRCGAENEILELAAALRENKIWDKDIFEYEIYLRQKYNDWNECKKILEDFIKVPLDDEYLPYARAHLSHVAGVLHENGLIETDSSRLPSPSEVDPGMGRLVVQSLRLAGEPLKAVDYAYEVLRAHFGSQEAHLMMMSFTVPLGPKSLGLKRPEKVVRGVAVQYQEELSTIPVWHIIEDSTGRPPDISRCEYAVDHPYSQRMLGLKKGDTFVLRGDEIQERKATVLQTVSKYDYRISNCMYDFEDRFPDSQIVVRINAYRKDGQIDIDPIRRLADTGEEQGKELLRLYREQPLPIYSLARMHGRDLHVTLGYLIGQPATEVHCRSGHASEIEAGVRALEEAEEIVLDEMTLTTLLFCDVNEHLSRIPKKLVVSAGTLLNIENWEAMRADPNNPGMVAGNVNGELTFIARSREEVEATQKRIQALIGFIGDHCVIESGVPLSFLEGSQRDLFARTLGDACAETMAITRTGRRVLWTDDMVLAAVFSQGLGGSRVWSQLVFEYLGKRRLIDMATVHDLTLKLVSFHYWFTSLNAGAAVAAVSKSNWDADSSPLREVLAHFGDGRVTLDTNLMLMISRLLKHCWTEDVVGLKASAITVRVLNELRKRREAPIPALINALWIWVQRVFGPDILTARQIRAIFRDWLESRSSGIIVD